MLCDVLFFWLFEGSTTQLPNKSHVEAYSYLGKPGLSLARFLPAFLKFARLPFSSGFFPFLLYILLSLLLLDWLGEEVAGPCHAPLFSCSSSSPFFLFMTSACQPYLSLLLPCYWLFSSLLDHQVF